MITTIADFIEEFKLKGLSDIKKNEDVNHPGMIGNMYEGLTHEMLRRAVFEGFNLKIVSGKITNGKHQMSRQIDCMVVEGNGRQLPFSNDWVYHYDQVIAVIEVKKNLFSDDIQSSYGNLESVITVSKEIEKDGDPYILDIFRDTWRFLLRYELPDRSELDSLPWHEQALYHTLLMESYYPPRIVIGYYGLKTEYSLRQAFANFISESIKTGNKKDFGPLSIPNLIICGNNSIVKNNGMPFGMPFNYKETFYWHICASSNQSPLIHLLEILWTRLSYKFDLSSSIFGQDNDFLRTIKFLDCRVARYAGDTINWQYQCRPYSEEEFKEFDKGRLEPNPQWEPVFLTPFQFEIIGKLRKHNFIQIDADPEIPLIATDAGLSVNDFLAMLVETGLIYIKNNQIHFLTDKCVCASLPDGRFVAGEDKNGNFTRWIQKYMDERKKNDPKH